MESTILNASSTSKHCLPRVPYLSSRQKLIVSLVITALTGAAAIFLYIKGYQKTPLVITASVLTGLSLVSLGWVVHRIRQEWIKRNENLYLASHIPIKPEEESYTSEKPDGATCKPDTPYSTPSSKQRKSVANQLKCIKGGLESIENAKQLVLKNPKTFIELKLDKCHTIFIYATNDGAHEYQMNLKEDSTEKLINELCPGYENCRNVIEKWYAFEFEVYNAHSIDYVNFSRFISTEIKENEYWITQFTPNPTSYICFFKQQGNLNKLFFNEHATVDTFQTETQKPSMENGFLRWKSEVEKKDTWNFKGLDFRHVKFFNGIDFSQ